MLGFLIGTACLIGLVKVLRFGRGYGHARSCGWGGRGYGRGGFGGDDFGGFGGGGGFGGHHGGPPWAGFGGEMFFLRQLSRLLDATPGQEKVIREAVEEVRRAASELKGEGRTSRGDVAKALRSEGFDEVLFGEMFHRHDVAMDTVRKAVMGALAKVHAVLDERQRARLADLVEQGPGAFRGRPQSWDRGGYASV
jgi:Spy/CpxP family protein refolding chaperone